MMMIQTHYIIFPLYYTVSDQEGVQSKGEGQQTPETAALLAEEYHHQDPYQEEAAPAPPVLTQSPIDLRILGMRYQDSFGNSGRRTGRIALPNNQRQSS
jgi:hypothetical protein